MNKNQFTDRPSSDHSVAANRLDITAGAAYRSSAPAFSAFCEVLRCLHLAALRVAEVREAGPQTKLILDYPDAIKTVAAQLRFVAGACKIRNYERVFETAVGISFPGGRFTAMAATRHHLRGCGELWTSCVTSPWVFLDRDSALEVADHLAGDYRKFATMELHGLDPDDPYHAGEFRLGGLDFFAPNRSWAALPDPNPPKYSNAFHWREAPTSRPNLSFNLSDLEPVLRDLRRVHRTAAIHDPNHRDRVNLVTVGNPVAQVRVNAPKVTALVPNLLGYPLRP
jgi:hypothetical protein